MRYRDVQRLVAAHRQPRDRAALTIGQHPVVLLDVRQQIGREIVGERIRSAADSGHPLRRRGRHAAAERRAGAVDVTGRHHDDHRLRLVGRDQVVEDEARASDRAPRIVDVAGAVQQVEDTG